MCELCEIKQEVRDLRSAVEAVHADLLALRTHLLAALEQVDRAPPPALLPRDGRSVLSGREAARFLGVSPKTLEGWRYKGGGPPFHKLSSRKVGYHVDDLNKWIAERRRRSTSDDGQ